MLNVLFILLVKMSVFYKVIGSFLYLTCLAKELLSASDKEFALQAFGKLMYESHDSSRVYFENSCPELDEVVEAAKQTGKVYRMLFQISL